MLACPNKNSSDWKDLVNEVGEENAYLEWNIRYNEDWKQSSLSNSTQTTPERDSFYDIVIGSYVSAVHDVYNKKNGFDETIDRNYSNLRNSEYTRDSELKSDIQRKVDVMQKTLNVKIEFDETMDNRGALLSSNHPLSKKFGIPVIMLNPNIMLSDTVFHEFGHLYIELLGGMKDPIVRQAIAKLKFTDFHYEVMKNYPELTGENLDKELLATALGLEADKLFDRDLDSLTWWVKILNIIKEKLSSIFKGKDSDYLLQLANEMLSGNTRHDPSAKYQSSINLYSKYQINEFDDNDQPLNVDKQQEAIKLFAQLREDIKQDFEDGKHDYLKDGNVITSMSISGVAKKMALAGSNFKTNGNLGSFEVPFIRADYTKDTLFMELGRPVIPLSLAQALDEFLLGDITGVPSNFEIVGTPNNWHEQYINEIVKMTKTSREDEMMNLFESNLRNFDYKHTEIVPASDKVTFRQDILDNLEGILDRAEAINRVYGQASIVGNSLHKAFENIVDEVATDLPLNIKDETGQLVNTIKEILDNGKKNGSVFFSEQPLWDNNGERAGTADLIEILKDGSFRIYDYKTIKSLLRNDGVTPKSDYELYVQKGYLHQLLAYGNILIDYGLQPADNAYNVLLMNTAYSNITSEQDDFTVKNFRLKSMEDLGYSYTEALKSINREFKPKFNLDDINLNSEIETLGDVSTRIHNVIKLFKSKLNSKTKGIDTNYIERVYKDLKENADVDFIKEYNKYGTKENIKIIKSFIQNVHDTLKSLEDSRINSINSQYIMGLNYIIQVGDQLFEMKDVITNKVLLEKEGLNEEESVDLINNLNDTINIINTSKEYFQNKLKESAIHLLAENSSLSEGRISELLERDARQSGLRKREDIREYIFQNLPKRKAQIRSKEIAYWTAQYENGILDLRTIERWMADPGMIKSQFVQVAKKMMDTNDMFIRKEMMTLAPEIENWYNGVKSNNPKGGTLKQWGRFINKSEVFIPQTGKYEKILDGTLISENISDYMLDKQEMNRKVNNLMYEKKFILDKPNKQLSNTEQLRLEKITDEISKLYSEFRSTKQKNRLAKNHGYFTARVNPDFKKLSEKDQETLRYIHNKLRESDEIIDERNLKLTDDLGDNVIIYNLPKQRMGYHESVGNSSIKSNFVSKFKDIYRPASDDTEMNTTEEEFNTKKEKDFSNINTDIDGNSIFNIPIWYRNQLEDPKLQSYDIPTLILENHQTSLNYKQGTELEADLFIIQESLNDTNGVKIIKTDSFISDKLKDRTGNIFKKSDSNNIYNAIKSSIDNRLYKRPYVGTYTQKNYALIKGMEMLTRYSSLNALSFNFKSALATSTQGGIFRLIEGMIGEYFNMDDWKKGTTKTYADLMEVMRDAQRHVPKSKTNLLLRHFGLEQNAQILANKFVQDNFANKNLDSNSLYAVTAIAEKTVTTMLMYSLLNNVKAMDINQNYLDVDGNITDDRAKAMSLDEAYTVEDGVLKLNPKVIYTTHNLLEKYNNKGDDTGLAGTEISGYIQDVYADLYGQYNEHLKTEAQRTIIGKMVMSMKGWLPRGLHRRFRGISTAIPIKSMGFLDFESLHLDENLDKRFYSQSKKQFQEGYYSTLLRFVGTLIHSNQRKTMGIIGGGKEVWNQLNSHEKANIKRSMIEMSLMLSLTALTILMTAIAKGYDDDDDQAKKDRIYMLAYMTYRVNDELTTFVNPKSFLNMIQNPAAAFNTYASVHKLVKRMIGMEYEDGEVNWTINDRYERGAKEGELKVTHDAFKLINPINQVKQIGSLLGIETGKTIEDSYKGQMLANEQ